MRGKAGGPRARWTRRAQRERGERGERKFKEDEGRLEARS